MKDFFWGIQLRIVKRWTRSGIDDFLKFHLMSRNSQTKVLVIGGFGPILEHIKKYNFNLTTLDINPNHYPDLLMDLSSKDVIEKVKAKYDFVVLMEVLEHIPEYQHALRNVYYLLNENGILLGSTPWVIPIHDYPNDYHRFTNFELERILVQFNFNEIEINSRGSFFQSWVALSLRGFFDKKFTNKVLSVGVGILSFFLTKPKLTDLQNISTIGYVFSAKK